MSNAYRDFTVVRRRLNLIDILIPKSATTKGYRLQAASNFDGAFTTILTADIGSGYLDPAVDANNLQALNNTGHIRVVFDPQTFNSVAGISDNQHFWLRFVPVDFAGTPGTEGNPTLILPDDELRAQTRVIIAGTAPSGAAVADSLVLNLPFRMRDITVRNNELAAGTVLYVATAVGGSERQVPGQTVAEFKDGAQACLLVRGGGGTASFSADFTHYLPL